MPLPTPSHTRSMPISAGLGPPLGPTTADAGAGPPALAPIRYSRLVPSTMTRSVPSSGEWRGAAGLAGREHPGVLLLVDLDGVVYRGSDDVPGVGRVLADRAAAGDTVIYVTNNA